MSNKIIFSVTTLSLFRADKCGSKEFDVLAERKSSADLEKGKHKLYTQEQNRVLHCLSFFSNTILQLKYGFDLNPV